MKTKILALCLMVAFCFAGTVSSFAEEPKEDAAVFCSECKTIFVKERTGVPGKGFRSFRTKEKMTCSGCESAVANFFKTGNFQHTCDVCGETLNLCKEMK